MKEDIEFEVCLNKITIDSVIENPDVLLQMVNADTLDRIEQYVLDNLASRDGAPHLSDIRISNFRYNTTTNKGLFRFSFSINRFYCCSETEASNSDYIDFNFHKDGDCLFARAEYFVWELNN